MAKLLALAIKGCHACWLLSVRGFHWCRLMLSECDGTPSWARTGSAVIVACWCYVFVRNLSVPERTADVAFLLAALYGANQLREAVGKYREMKDQAPIVPVAPQG